MDFGIFFLSFSFISNTIVRNRKGHTGVANVALFYCRTLTNQLHRLFAAKRRETSIHLPESAPFVNDHEVTVFP